MTTRKQADEAPTRGVGARAEPNTLSDQFGNERPYDAEKYPDDSPAKTGNITQPSGQGGITPKSRPDHQDMFPPNPEPSESAREKGEENDRVLRGEVSPVSGEPYGATPDTKAKSDPKATSNE